MMRMRILSLIWFVSLQVMGTGPADPSSLMAQAGARRTACENRVRALVAASRSGHSDTLEAERLYRNAWERANLFLDLVVWDLRTQKEGQECASLALESDATTRQLEGFLSKSSDAGASPSETESGPIYIPLLASLRGSSALLPKERAATIAALEGLRWRPLSEVMPASASRRTGLSAPAVAGVQTPGQSAPKAGEKVRSLAGTGVELDAPMLALETGFHMAPIRQAVLEGTHGLVTAGEDKTIRVWDLQGLALRRVIRPPQGPGETGKIYALALSPDGRTLACGGFTGNRGQHNHRVYLMDLMDGRLLRELPGFPQPATHLAFSPDGTILVIHLAGREGLRFIRTDDSQELARDDRFEATTYAGAFLPGGRYVASSDDGYLRMYTSKGQRLAKVLAAGESPFGLAPSPDGKQLALGYASGPRVDVLSARTLMPIRTLRGPQDKEPLSAVTWSWDGTRIFAAGGDDFGTKPNRVYQWSALSAESGTGVGTPLPGVEVRATISTLLATPDGGLVVAAQDPALLRLDQHYREVARKTAEQGDLRKASQAFWMDPAGKVISMDWKLGPRPEAAFSLLEQGLEVRPAEPSVKPTAFQGQVPGLDPFEAAHCRLGHPDGKGDFFLGTDWVLRRCAPGGEPRWSIAVPAACWALGVTPDGRTLSAVLADGTVRWYLAATGQEELAFFMSSDASRWVLWNPQGRFTCSAGGESMLGWLVQREGQAGDFLPCARFRDRFYSPDLGRRPREAVLAPLPSSPLAGGSLEILAPRAREAVVGQNRLRLRLRMDPSVPLPSKRQAFVKVDDAAQPPVAPVLLFQRRSREEAEQILEMPVELAIGRHLLEVGLELGDGTRPVVRMELDVPASGPSLPPEPSVLNLVAVGVGKYRDPQLDLRFAAKDARDVIATFRSQAGGLYSDVRVTELLDQEATRGQIEKALNDLRQRVRSSDVTVVFLSGHGFNDPVSNAYYFVPHDAVLGNVDSLVDGSRIQQDLSMLPGKVILLMDTCHAGNVMGAGALRGVFGQQQLAHFINELSSAGNGVAVLSSSTGRQTSLESEAWGNGAFTKALIEGLTGKADLGASGRVTLVMLDGFLRKRVGELTHGRQTPVSGHPFSARDFPLALIVKP
jgi:hypothetical protein